MSPTGKQQRKGLIVVGGSSVRTRRRRYRRDTSGNTREIHNGRNQKQHGPKEGSADWCDPNHTDRLGESPRHQEHTLAADISRPKIKLHGDADSSPGRKG